MLPHGERGRVRNRTRSLRRSRHVTAELTVQFSPCSSVVHSHAAFPRAPTYLRAAVSPGRAPLTVVWGCAHARPPPAALAVQRPL